MRHFLGLSEFSQAMGEFRILLIETSLILIEKRGAANCFLMRVSFDF